MSVNQQFEEVSVDHTEETIVTQQPGYATTEQVSHDVAAERRMGMFQMKRILYGALGILEIFLGLRFFLQLIAANPDSGFAWFIYGSTSLFVLPFNNVVSNWSTGGMTFEVTTLIAMAVYALFFWVLVRVVRIITDRPSARSVTRTTREHNPMTGTDRTVRSVRKD